MGKEGLQGSCQDSYGLQGWCYLPSPNPPCWADLWKGLYRSHPCYNLVQCPLGWSYGLHTGPCLNSHRARSEKKGMFPLSFPYIVHCAEAALYTCSMQSPPEPWTLFSWFPQSRLHCSVSFPTWVTFSLSWTIPHQKETWISRWVAEVLQLYFFLYDKSTTTEDPGAKSAYPRNTKVQNGLG